MFNRILNLPQFSVASVLSSYGSEYTFGSQYPRVLNMSLVLNILEFWISHNSEYARILNMPLVVSMVGFWICLWFSIYQGSKYARFTQGPEYTWICLNNSWICLIMLGYVWICLNIHQYAWICLSGFCFPCPHGNHLFTWIHRYLFEQSL